MHCLQVCFQRLKSNCDDDLIALPFTLAIWQKNVMLLKYFFNQSQFWSTSCLARATAELSATCVSAEICWKVNMHGLICSFSTKWLYNHICNMVGTVDFVIETKATSDDHGRRALVYSTPLPPQWDIETICNNISKGTSRQKQKSVSTGKSYICCQSFHPKKSPMLWQYSQSSCLLVQMQTEQISKSHEFSPL